MLVSYDGYSLAFYESQSLPSRIESLFFIAIKLQKRTQILSHVLKTIWFSSLLVQEQDHKWQNLLWHFQWDHNASIESTSKNNVSAVETETVSKYARKYLWSLPINEFSLYNVFVVQVHFPF